jgi:cell cycle sensor histidine kinase DivJ
MPGDLPQMTGDERAFKQILLNLLSNAIKFTGEGGKVIVSAQVDGRELLLHVTDTGIGIGKDDLACLGNPFFQAGASYQGRHEGTGLGLSIVKSLVSLHGGEMKVESELDRGTTVSVRLPMVFAPAAKPSNITTLAPALRADANVTLVKKIA